MALCTGCVDLTVPWAGQNWDDAAPDDAVRGGILAADTRGDPPSADVAAGGRLQLGTGGTGGVPREGSAADAGGFSSGVGGATANGGSAASPTGTGGTPGSGTAALPDSSIADESTGTGGSSYGGSGDAGNPGLGGAGGWGVSGGITGTNDGSIGASPTGTGGTPGPGTTALPDSSTADESIGTGGSSYGGSGDAGNPGLGGAGGWGGSGGILGTNGGALGSTGGAPGTGGMGATGGTTGAGGSTANLYCATFIDLGTLPSTSTKYTAVPSAATCFRFTVPAANEVLRGIQMSNCGTRTLAINGASPGCTPSSNCHVETSIRRAADGYWYLEFSETTAADCASTWWWALP